MKTIVHIELSDSDRNDLARRIDRDPVTKRLVTRKEVTEHVLALVNDEITLGWESTTDDRGKELTNGNSIPEHASTDDVHPTSGQEGKSGDDSTPGERPSFAQFCNEKDADPNAFTPSRGDEDYLTQPKSTDISAACRRILSATELIEEFAWNTIERNRK
jgi:hypothetical protein